MDTSELVRDVSVSPKPNPRSSRFTAGLIWFPILVVAGGLAIVYPFPALVGLAVVAMLGLAWLGIRSIRGAGLELWQVLLLTALTGYTLLNRGFENLTIHIGIPIIISYMLMFSALILGTLAHPGVMRRVRDEPAVMCLALLLILAFFHLVEDFPTYGIWAIRDASMFIDGIFMVLGFLWATSGKSTIFLMKWFMAILPLNLLYSFTLPWSETITNLSPRSGVFLQVPIFGNYAGNAIYLLLGALFCVFLAGYVVKWPRWILFLLAMAQLAGLAIHQARALYVALAAILVLLVLVGEAKKSAKLVLMLAPGLAGILLLSALGIELSGRIGVVSVDFLKEHLRSISGAEGTPGSSVAGRLNWLDQTFDHIRAHPVYGGGFGMVLIDESDTNTGAAIRQPHNSSISVLARMGAIGLLPWLAFHVCLLSRFIYALWRRREYDKQLGDLILWLFIVYLIYMIESNVEPSFEFPSASIPFYFYMGLALGLIRWQLPRRAERKLVYSHA